jgi:hypothetical protein
MTARDPRDLPREIEPPRDLWPDIAARLDEAPREQPARPADADHAGTEVLQWRQRLAGRGGLTAALAVAATIAVVLIAGPDRTREVAPAEIAATAGSGGGTPPVAALEQGYAAVRADLVTVLDQQCDRWPDVACAGLRTGLKELDQTARELDEALRQAPPGSETARRLAGQYQRTLEHARGLAGHAARL